MTNCKNCGAPLEDSRCLYCGSTFFKPIPPPIRLIREDKSREEKDNSIGTRLFLLFSLILPFFIYYYLLPLDPALATAPIAGKIILSILYVPIIYFFVALAIGILIGLFCLLRYILTGKEP